MYGVRFGGTNLLKMSLVMAAAMLGICLLALVETTDTAQADDSLPENGKIAFSIIQGQSHKFYTVDPDGSSLSRLTTIANSTYDAQPAWSPNGTKIAFGSQDSIWGMDADGSNLRRLTPNRSDVSYSDPDWAPDGTKLAFTGFIEPEVFLRDIYTMDVDGANITNITNTPGIHESGIDFSPDGSQMCLNRSFDVPGKSGLYVMNVDTSDSTQLTDWHGGGCAWSPDGKKVAYTYEQPKQRGATIQDFDVYVISAFHSSCAGVR